MKYEWKVPTVTIASHASHAWCATSSLQIRSLPRNTLFHSHHSTKVNKGDSSLTTPQLVCEVLVHFMPRAMAIYSCSFASKAVQWHLQSANTLHVRQANARLPNNQTRQGRWSCHTVVCSARARDNNACSSPPSAQQSQILIYVNHTPRLRGGSNCDANLHCSTTVAQSHQACY